MERPYANGVGYRLVVDFFQHHVAFTTHPFRACLGSTFAKDDSEAVMGAIVPLPTLWVNHQCPSNQDCIEIGRRMYRLGKGCVHPQRAWRRPAC